MADQPKDERTPELPDNDLDEVSGGAATLLVPYFEVDLSDSTKKTTKKSSKTTFDATISSKR